MIFVKVQPVAQWGVIFCVGLFAKRTAFKSWVAQYLFNSLCSTWWKAVLENSENQQMHLVHTEPKKDCLHWRSKLLQGILMKKHPPNLCSHIHWNLLSAMTPRHHVTVPSCSLDTLHVEFGKTIYTNGCWTKNSGKTPKWMVKIMENTLKNHDLGGKPLFWVQHPNRSGFFKPALEGRSLPKKLRFSVASLRET